MSIIFVKVEVKNSEIPDAGRGLFAAELIVRGRPILQHVTPSCEMIHEAEFQYRCGKGNKMALQTGIRVFGDWFAVMRENSLPLDHAGFYVNHSSKPNADYVCGLLVASRIIVPGEEITQDYGLWLPLVDSENKPRSFLEDGATGQPVKGEAGFNQLNRTVDILRSF